MKRADISVMMAQDWMLPVVKLLMAGDFKAALSLFLEKTRSCDWNDVDEKTQDEMKRLVAEYQRETGGNENINLWKGGKVNRNKVRRSISNAMKGKDLWRYSQRLKKYVN